METTSYRRSDIGEVIKTIVDDEGAYPDPGQAPRCLAQRAGIAPPHAAGDGSSGVTSDGEMFAFISGPGGVVGGVPLTRAMNPWAMPEAST